MITLKPVDSRYTVPPLDKLGFDSEFEIQAWLYMKLRDAGINAKGEVRWIDRKESVHCRFDIVIYADKKPIHLIEVKPRPIKHKTCLEDTRQGRRYRLFGLPVTFVYGMDDAKRFLSGAIDIRSNLGAMK